MGAVCDRHTEGDPQRPLWGDWSSAAPLGLRRVEQGWRLLPPPSLLPRCSLFVPSNLAGI